jgi:translation initiation factor 3 subunit C
VKSWRHVTHAIHLRQAITTSTLKLIRLPFPPTTPSPNMASRFFHGGDSDSESSSSDEEELYSDKEEKEESEEESEEQDSDEESSSDESGKGTGANRFLKPSGGGADDSDESEDEDRVTVVKSAKDKRLEEVEATIKLIDNAERINDWAVISTGMD